MWIKVNLIGVAMMALINQFSGAPWLLGYTAKLGWRPVKLTYFVCKYNFKLN